MSTVPPRLVGRDEVLGRVLGTVTSPTERPLTLVTGPSGIGRSTVLSVVRDSVARREITTVEIRMAQHERHQPCAGLLRLGNELFSLYRAWFTEPTRAADGPLTNPRPVLTGTLLSQLVAALAGTGRPLVVLIDDAQWLDQQSVDTLAAVVGSLAGSAISVVCAYRTPAPDAARHTLAGLRAEGLAHEVALRPLHESETDLLIARLLQATPSPDLRRTVCRPCRGMPGVIVAAVAEFQRIDALRSIDQHAYLRSTARPPAVPADSALFRQLRLREPLVWPVVKALALLYPLGDAAATLVGETIGCAEHAVLDVLRTLRAEGVLIEGPKPNHWRFRVPFLAVALVSCLGPFDTRSMSARAVTAIWQGSAVCPDDRYLLDRLVDAGRLVEPTRAAAELLAGGGAHLLTMAPAATRWLHAAAELCTDPDQRAHATARYATSRLLAGDPSGAVASSRIALSRDVARHTPDTLLELTIVQLTGLLDSAGPEPLSELADEGWRSVPGGPTNQLMARVAALYLLSRPAEARTLLDEHRAELSGNSTPAALGAAFDLISDAFCRGMPPGDAEPGQPWPDRYRMLLIAVRSWTLLMCGELAGAEKALPDNGLPGQRPSTVDRTLRAALSGRWDEALDLARTVLADPSAGTVAAARTGVYQHLAVILTARGRPSRARQVLVAAAAEPLAMVHLLAPADAELARLVGDTGQAREILARGLDQAAEQQVVVGTDELHWRLIELDLAAGDQDAARRRLTELARAAEAADTGRARRNHLLGRVAVLRDATAADEVVRLARDRAQPHELAETLSVVCANGLDDRDQLLEAYQLFGELGALVPRALLRSLMRERRVSVPGRQATVLENERLLALLVTEGLTNREVAALLQTTEKSVEGRLTRLFQRTGYQSRAELAGALLTGEFVG